MILMQKLADASFHECRLLAAFMGEARIALRLHEYH